MYVRFYFMKENIYIVINCIYKDPMDSVRMRRKSIFQTQTQLNRQRWYSFHMYIAN